MQAKLPASQQLTRARVGLLLDNPFFGSLATRQMITEDATIETADTNGKVIRFNPAFVESLSLDETKTVIAHEAMHIGLGHHTRRGNRDPRLWNMACDYAVNRSLLQSGFRMPDGALIGQQDWSAEQYYTDLQQKQPKPDQPGQGQNQQSGSPNGQPGQGQNQPGNGQGQPSQDPGRMGSVSDAPGPDGKPASKTELAQAEAESRVAMSQALASAKRMGSIPGHLARLVAEILDPLVPWREVLRRFAAQITRNDYTWTRPNARYLASGLYLPSLYNQELGQIVVAIDTSGSIGQAEIDRFATELTAIIEDTRASATVIYCDSHIGKIDEFTPDDLPLTLQPVGGGGTDFRPPFAEVDKRGLTPACLVYLTDGECSRFPEEPDYPVLWAITGAGAARYFKPPFGEVTAID